MYIILSPCYAISKLLLRLKNYIKKIYFLQTTDPKKREGELELDLLLVMGKVALSNVTNLQLKNFRISIKTTFIRVSSDFDHLKPIQI